ncbi:MAG TPA: nucleoside-triphosphatase [Elusimicrobiales bacterium]|nr:nucleoside-triphosphatase [Elusimicrobiales bacterium]
MAAGKKITAPALCALSALYAAACAVLYPRARALLSRAGVWAGVLGASLLAGLLMGSAAAGFYMALRAFMLTFGFSAIGSELLNPRIRARLERLGGGVFFETLEYAFSALPGMIAALPAGREIARRPVASLRAVISRAPALLDAPERPALFLITGVQGSGKSQLVAGLAEGLRRAGKKPGGICAEGFWENGARAGFDLINLASGARAPLCRRGKGGKVRAGAFRFYEEGLAAGAQALSTAGLAGADAVFVDEVGFLELEGGGWAGPLKELCHSRRPLILAVRDSLADKVPEHFGLDRPVIWKAGHVTAQDALPALLAALETAQKTAG